MKPEITHLVSHLASEILRISFWSCYGRGQALNDFSCGLLVGWASPVGWHFQNILVPLWGSRRSGSAHPDLLFGASGSLLTSSTGPWVLFCRALASSWVPPGSTLCGPHMFVSNRLILSALQGAADLTSTGLEGARRGTEQSNQG